VLMIPFSTEMDFEPLPPGYALPRAGEA
jgi:hypothetical protein